MVLTELVDPAVARRKFPAGNLLEVRVRPCFVGRIRSGVRVNASLQIVALQIVVALRGVTLQGNFSGESPRIVSHTDGQLL